MECKKSSFITPEKKSKMLIPYAVLCELTHRCPLSCPYCSNPVQLEMKSNEVSTEIWKKALTEAVKLGILQAHFSGGEPTARKDLEILINHASKEGLYTNLITSGVLVNEERLKKLSRRRRGSWRWTGRAALAEPASRPLFKPSSVLASLRTLLMGAIGGS